ncbi:MAG: hypothetical protein J1F16_00245 [Muribaculaceae bacterium]|nr:hypothetical protein [Muribaculaceae bacterium]
MSDLRAITFKFILLLALSAGLTSCVYHDAVEGPEAENRPGGNKGDSDEDMANVAFVIKPIARASNSEGPWEKIKYLRIVMLDKNNKIEYNRLISFPTPQGSLDQEFNPTESSDFSGVTADSNFEYTYTTPAKVGQKSFYIIANEQSVRNIKFQWPEGYTPPQGLKNLIAEKPDGLSLSDVLTYYAGGFEANFPDRKDEFNTVMNSIWFEPDYSIDTEGNIYLPYSSFYTGADFVVQKLKDDNSNLFQEFRDMYLVPAATKFTFSFVNKRPTSVYVKSISISSEMPENYDGSEQLPYSISDSEYLFGQVETPEKDGKYWVDWLQKVAQDSWNPGSGSTNSSVNALYGWIQDYSLPENAENKEVIWAPESSSGEWVVPPGSLNTDGSVASTGLLPLGPFYEPESKNEITREFYVTDSNGNPVYDDNGEIKTEAKEMQAYFLTLDLLDPSETDPKFQKPEFVAVEIAELQSLFRATHVHIEIVMGKNDYGIYAEIREWSEKTAHGYVEEKTPENIDQND